MVKKMILKLSVLLLVAVCISSCSNNDKYTNAIPANASVVASINIKSLFIKTGLTDKSSEATKQKIVNVFKTSLNAATFEQVEKMMKNPKESGLDVMEPLYIFVSPAYAQGVLIAKVNDEDNLRKTLDLFSKEQVCSPVTETSDFSFTKMNNLIFAFNEAVAICMEMPLNSSIENVQKSIAELMKQDESNSATDKLFFKNMNSQKGDINFFLAFGSAIPNNMQSKLTFGLSEDIKPEDLNLMGEMSFEKGKISLKADYYSEKEEIKTLLKKHEKAMKKVDGSFLKYFPESTVAFFNIGINGEEFYNMLKDNKEFCDAFTLAKAQEVKTFLSAFKGDLSIGVLNASLEEAPAFIAYATVDNKNALQTLYKRKNEIAFTTQTVITKVNENSYVFKSPGYVLYLGMKDNTMYITNSEAAFSSALNTYDRSIKEAPYASEMNGKQFFGVLNTKAMLELPMVKMMLKFGGEEYLMYNKMASKISHTTYSISNEKTELVLTLNDKNTNALKQIVDFGKQFAGL